MALKYPTTSKTLLAKIASGDEIGWDEFFARYSPVIKAVARYKGLKSAEADDVCQQVMLQFFKQSRSFKFDPDIARVRTYFGRIVHSKIADFLRRKTEVLPAKDIPETPCDPESDRLFMTEWRKTVLSDAERELKSRVSPRTYQAYELYAVQNRPPEKVAAFLGCSVNQVYQAKKRCFAIMREILLKMNESDPELRMELSDYGI